MSTRSGSTSSGGLGGSTSSLGGSMRLDLTDVSLCGRRNEMEQLNEILQQISTSTSSTSTTTTSSGSSNSNVSNGGNAAPSSPTPTSLSTINESTATSTSTTNGTTTTTTTTPAAAISSSSSSSTRALVTITGKEGVGKTSLVLSQLQQKWINEGKCLFGHGVFSRSKMSDTNNKLQFMAIFDAVTNLIQMWVHQQQDICGVNLDGDGKKGQQQCQAKIREFANVMKDHACLLREAIPHLCDILGISNDDNDTTTVARRNSSTEFNADTASSGCGFASIKNALQKVLCFLCSSSEGTGTNCRRRPVILFLDNFQNACSMSMELLQYVVECQTLQGLMVIVSYRDNEVSVDGNNSWIATGLQELQQRSATNSNGNSNCSECSIYHIHLNELTVNHVNCMVSQITERSRGGGGDDEEALQETLELATIVHSKTGGNPYYVLQVRTCDSFSLLIFARLYNVLAGDMAAGGGRRKVGVSRALYYSPVRLPRVEFAFVHFCYCLWWWWWETPKYTFVHPLFASFLYSLLLFSFQFLQTLCDLGHLTFNVLNYRWEWDTHMNEIRNATNISDNVAELVTNSIKRLPSDMQQMLLVASTLGVDSIPYLILHRIFQDLNSKEESKEQESIDGYEHLSSFLSPSCSVNKLPQYLELAVKMGILNPVYGSTTAPAVAAVTATTDANNTTISNAMFYHWSHDKIQQGIYGFLASETDPITGKNDSLKFLHLRVGKVVKTLSEQHPKEEWMVYVAADQFNTAVSYCDPNYKNVDLATLNLRAAKISIKKSAYFPAANMLQACAKRLPDDSWKNHYDLCLQLYSTMAETEFVVGHHDAAMDAVQNVLDNATSLEDKFRAHNVQLQNITDGATRDFELGITMTRKVLGLYGVNVERHPLPGTLTLQRRKLKPMESFFEMDEMTDKRARRISKLIQNLSKLAFIAANSASRDDWHFPRLVATRSFLHYQEFGVSADTATTFLFAAKIAKMEAKFTKANEYADFANRFIDRYPESPDGIHAMIKSFSHASIYPTIKPFHKCLEHVLEGYKVAMRTGNITVASVGSMCYGMAYLCLGLSLGPLEADLLSFGEEAKQFGRGLSLISVFQIMRQTIVNLQTRAENPTVLDGHAFDQEAILAQMDSQSKAMTMREIRTFQLMLACIYGDFKVARKLIDQLSVYSLSDLLEPRKHLRTSYLGIASMIVGRERGWRRKCKYGSLGKKILKRYKAEAECGSVNAHPIMNMLLAEENPSKEAYDRSIRECARSGLLHHQALMYERAGLYFLSKKDEGDFEFYIQQSCLLYEDWGAWGKVEQMHDKYPFLSKSSRGGAGSSTSSSSGRVGSSLQGRTRHEKGLTEALMRFSVDETAPPPAK